MTLIDDVFRVVPMDAAAAAGASTPADRVRAMVIDKWLPAVRDVLRRRLAADKAVQSAGNGAGGARTGTGGAAAAAVEWKQAYRAALLARDAAAAVGVSEAVAGSVARAAAAAECMRCMLRRRES